MNVVQSLTIPRAILFDMDGTLTQPRLNFDEIRRDMGIRNGPILEALAMMNANDRLTAEAILLQHEDRAAEESTLNRGCREVLKWIDQAGIASALVTRNTRKSVDTVFRRHGLHFDVCVTREDGKYKPDPAPLQLACERLKVGPAQAWMVGDGYHDIEAGMAAKMPTIWVSHGKPRDFMATPTHIVNDLLELMELLKSRFAMQRLAPLVFTILLMISTCVFAQGIDQRVSPLEAGKSNVDDVLDALQLSGKDLKSFTADVQLKIEDEVMSTSSTQFGKAWFQTKADGNAVLHVKLDHKVVAGKVLPHKIDYLLDDGWLTERDLAQKKEMRMQLSPPGEKVNLFQLGKGPFPLPIGQKKEDVHAQFDVKIIAPDKDDPANTIHLQLSPKPGTPLDESFSTIDVWTDCKTRMPARMATDNKKHTEYKTTDLLKLLVNLTIKPDEIALPPLEKDWNTIDKPLPAAN